MTMLGSVNISKLEGLERELRNAKAAGYATRADSLKVQVRNYKKTQALTRKAARQIKLSHRAVAR